MHAKAQARPLDFLIIDLHELHLRKKIYMVDTRYNMKLADLNSKPHGGKSLRDVIDRTIGACLYPSPWSKYCKLLLLEQFHGPSHINNNHENINEENIIMRPTNPTKMFYARKNTTNTIINQM